MQRILNLQKLEVLDSDAASAGSCTSSWSNCC